MFAQPAKSKRFFSFLRSHNSVLAESYEDRLEGIERGALFSSTPPMYGYLPCAANILFGCSMHQKKFAGVEQNAEQIVEQIAPSEDREHRARAR